MSFVLPNEEVSAVHQTASDFPSAKLMGQFSEENGIDENEEFKYQEDHVVEDDEKNKKQNVRIEDIKVMLANGPGEAEEEDTGLKFPVENNSVSLDKIILVDNNKSSVNCDVVSIDGNVADDVVPTDVKLEIEDNCPTGEDNNYDLRIYVDENEMPETKFDAKLGQSTINDECSLQELSLQSSDHVPNQSYLSSDLKYDAISDTVNNNGDGNVEKLTPVAATVDMLGAVDDCVSRSIHDCVWCVKQFTAKKSLKSHILTHLRGLKHEAKGGNLSTSEVDSSTSDDTDACGTFACVFCDTLCSNKKEIITHYVTVHTQSDSQLQSRSKRTALNGPYWQSCESKLPSSTTTAPVISVSNEESSALKVGENGSNEDMSKQYKCYLCDKQFARHSSLMWHYQFHERSKYPKYEKNISESDLPSPVVVDVDTVPDNFMNECDDNINGTSTEYTCDTCDCHFTHLNNYLQHIQLAHQTNDEEVPSHLQTSGHKCESCGKVFSTSSNMRKHIRKTCKGPSPNPDSEEDDELTCNICDRSFCSRRAVNIHRSSKHRYEFSDTAANGTKIEDLIPCDSYVENEENSFQCTVCDKIFETRKGVIRHIGYHRSAVNESINNSGNVSDDENEDEDEEVEEKEEEEEEETEDKSVSCPTCGKTFGSMKGMRIHANKHTEEAEIDDNDEHSCNGDGSDRKNESSYECHICKKSFEGFRSFKIHISWHSRREDAGVTPKMKADKNETVIIAQKKSDKCESVVIPQKSRDKSICSTPSSSKIHQCQYCPRWYTTQQALAGHMKVHQSLKTGKPQGSDQLQTGTSQGSSKQLQISDPKIDTLLKCQVCGQNFSTNSKLSEHMQSHALEEIPAISSGHCLTLEDTMKCDMCGKFFMHKQDMAKHMRDHMKGTISKENVDLSLFRCIYCEKSFVGRRSLNTHQRLHEEAQAALKRAASERAADAVPAKQPRLNEVTAGQDNSVGWDNTMQGHQCEKCDRRLASRQSLQRHMEWHSRMNEARGVSCRTANEVTVAAVTSSTPQEEQRHSDEEAVDEGPQTVLANDLEALGEHAVIQCVEGGYEEYFVFEQKEGEAFQCSECDETHYDKLQMIVHMAYHVGKRCANGRQRSLIIKADPIMFAPFECMFCDERFVNKRLRREHVVKRHGSDVKQCNSCRKFFLSKKRLAAHCQQHFSDPVYRCEHCSKCFTSKWFLKRHARKICVGESSQEIKQEQIFTPSDDVESLNDE